MTVGQIGQMDNREFAMWPIFRKLERAEEASRQKRDARRAGTAVQRERKKRVAKQKNGRRRK